MSQSDYIKYKKIQNELQINNKAVVAKKTIPDRMQNAYFNQPPVFDTSDYGNFKEYTLENTISNTKLIMNRVTPSGKQVVLDMDKTVPSNCATFLVCKNTNTRPNRVSKKIGINISSSNSKCYIIPTPVPANINIAEKNSNIKNACNCALNKSYSQNTLCKCKKSHSI